MKLRCTQSKRGTVHAVGFVGLGTLCGRVADELSDRDFRVFAAKYPHLSCGACVKAAQAPLYARED